MEFENQGIRCSSFWNAQAVIEKTEVKVKEAGSIKERKYYTQGILLELQSLLMCSNYNAGNPECISCHCILQRYMKEYGYLAKVKRKENAINK